MRRRAAPRRTSRKAQAHWVSRDTVAWNRPGCGPAGRSISTTLRPAGSPRRRAASAAGVEIPLTYDPAGLSADAQGALPPPRRLRGLQDCRRPRSREVPEALQSPARRLGGATPTVRSLDATSLQIPGVLDDLYAYVGALGATFSRAAPDAALWAPTARSVKLHLFADSSRLDDGTVLAMTRDAATGVWSDRRRRRPGTGSSTSTRSRSSRRATDEGRDTTSSPIPYSREPLAQQPAQPDRRPRRPAWKPAGWGALVKPRARLRPRTSSLYELHVRDFSATTRPCPRRCAEPSGVHRRDSDGMRHLAPWPLPGLTHVHLLPVLRLRDDRRGQVAPGSSRRRPRRLPARLRPAAGGGRGVAERGRLQLGLRPLHYTVPEGSYATEPRRADARFSSSARWSRR